MKIRNGFVTNSSSSSFIISVHGSKGEPLINFFKFMCDEDYFEWPQLIHGMRDLGTIMDIQKEMKADEFWGHERLKERIEAQDKTLLDKHFYDLTFERSWWDFREVLTDLIETTDGIKIESTDSY